MVDGGDDRSAAWKVILCIADVGSTTTGTPERFRVAYIGEMEKVYNKKKRNLFSYKGCQEAIRRLVESKK